LDRDLGCILNPFSMIPMNEFMGWVDPISINEFMGCVGQGSTVIASL